MRSPEPWLYSSLDLFQTTYCQHNKSRTSETAAIRWKNNADGIPAQSIQSKHGLSDLGCAQFAVSDNNETGRRSENVRGFHGFKQLVPTHHTRTLTPSCVRYVLG
jgi:hypothetical protein